MIYNIDGDEVLNFKSYTDSKQGLDSV